MAPDIKNYAKQYGVPPEAIAGAVADEFNKNNLFDQYQDFQIRGGKTDPIPPLPWDPLFSSPGQRWDDELKWAKDHDYNPFEKSHPLAGSDPDKIGHAITWDVGPGNFNVMTAISLAEKNPNLQDSLKREGVLSKSDDLTNISGDQADKIARYLVTDKGTSEFTAAYMQVITKRFQNAKDNGHNLDFGSGDQFSSNLIAYYKEGPDFLTRATSNSSEEQGPHSRSTHSVEGWDPFIDNEAKIKKSLG